MTRRKQLVYIFLHLSIKSDVEQEARKKKATKSASGVGRVRQTIECVARANRQRLVSDVDVVGEFAVIGWRGRERLGRLLFDVLLHLGIDRLR